MTTERSKPALAEAPKAGEPSMTKVFADSFEAVCAERDSLRAENEKLRQERDADRRREYGYSQETVDAISQERDALRDAVASLNIDAERGAKAETALRAEVERLKARPNCLEHEKQEAEITTLCARVAELEERILDAKERGAEIALPDQKAGKR